MIQQLTRRLLFQDEEKNLSLFRDFGTKNELYESVLQVRNARGNESFGYDFDDYSSHLVVFYKNDPVGALTTTRPRDGEIDCHSFYPTRLFDLYQDQIVSGCKLRIKPNPSSGMFLLRLMFREAWREQLDAGVRLDLINVEKKLVPFYRRIGYVVIENTDFIHPTLGTDSVVVMLPADPTRRSFCRDLFEAYDHPLLLKDVRAALSDERLAVAG